MMSQRADSKRCAVVLEQLEAWIDGDLDATEVARVEAHVDHCASCRAAMFEAQELVKGLRALPEFDVPQRVLRSVHKGARPAIGDRIGAALTSWMDRPVPVAAAIAIAVAATVVLFQLREPVAPQYTDQEIARATREAKLALAYVGNAVQRAELHARERVFEDDAVRRTVRGIGLSMRAIGGATPVSNLPATPLPQKEGS